MKVFKKSLRVSPGDLDELNHVNNVRYVQWIQDVSKDHWQKLAPPEIRDSMIWVVSRHDIRYKSPASLGETVQLETYIAKTQGVISERVVKMTLEPSGKLLLESRTEWCLLNADSLKPMRIPEAVATLFKHGGGKDLP